MTIGFYHIDQNTGASAQGYVYAQAMVRSAKAVMPEVPVVQFTDMTSPAVKGVSEVRRKPREPMALLRMRHHAGVEGEWLFVDTDVIFQQSVTKVFRKDFDIGVTTRNWSHLRPAAGFSERMPYNVGVVFSRCPQFWAEVYTRLRRLEPALQQWMGDQHIICGMVKGRAHRYHFALMKGSRYNFPPQIESKHDPADVMQANAAIVHYKGPIRKPLLLQRIHQESKRCA